MYQVPPVPVAYCVLTPSFSYFENDDVSPEAQNATAIPSATATAMRMTVAMTGETALFLVISSLDIIFYSLTQFNKAIDTPPAHNRNKRLSLEAS